MKIEKVNENQIRCFLTKEDLEERKISFGELTYGSEKANKLLRDMMQQANYEFGFEVDNMPLMIEAVPMQSGMIVFVITKVTDPDELDSRLSRVSSAFDRNLQDTVDDDDSDLTKTAEQDKSFEGTTATVSIPISSDDSAVLPSIGQALHDFFQEMFARQDNNNSSQPAKKQETQQNRLFCFRDMNSLLEAVSALSEYDNGESALYKDPSDGRYYLLLYSDFMTPSGYQTFCMLMSDFCERIMAASTLQSYVDEHYDLVIPSQAMQSLRKIL